MEQSNTPLFGLSIEGQTASTISSSVQWARILSICCIIFGGFFILLAIIIISATSRASSFDGYRSESGMGAVVSNFGMIGGIMYIIMGGLIILGNVFLLNYANKVSTALKTNDAVALNSGMAGLRNYFAFWAVMMIICLLLMLLSVLSGSMM
jgi:hypothetical protein